MKRSYFDLPPSFTKLEDSAFVILPVPYERTTSYVKGTAKGPEAVLRASWQVELFDEETKKEPYLKGIHSAKPLTFAKEEGELESLHKIGEAVSRYLKLKKFVVSIGGEHSITAGIVPVYAKAFDKISVLQIDAHPDLRDTYEGSPYNHACVGRRILEYAPLVQVGVRAWCKEQEEFMKGNLRKKREHALKVFPANETKYSKNWIQKVVASLSHNVYLTLDLDGLDPSVMPAVGTPEPGGLSWWQTLELLRAVTAKRKIVGMDVVELCPIEGQIIGDFATARLIYKILAMLA